MDYPQKKKQLRLSNEILIMIQHKNIESMVKNTKTQCLLKEFIQKMWVFNDETLNFDSEMEHIGTRLCAFWSKTIKFIKVYSKINA